MPTAKGRARSGAAIFSIAGVVSVTEAQTATPTPTPPPTSRIGIYANAAATDCDAPLTMFVPFDVFVVAKGPPGFKGANFRITNVTFPNISATITPTPGATITGDLIDQGVNIEFADCQEQLPLGLYKLRLFPFATGQRVLSVAASAGEDCPFITHCDGVTTSCVTAGSITLNPTGGQTNTCPDPPPPPTATPTPTPTRTPTASLTPSNTPTPSVTLTPSPTLTPSSTPSVTPTPSTTPTPSNTPTPSLTPTVTLTPVCGASGYDADLNGDVTALTDGLVILRHLFGFSGQALVQGAIGSGALRSDPAAIAAHLECLRVTLLDPDRNGQQTPLSDGLLLLRYFFGFRGAVLISGAVGPNCSNCTAAEIEAFIGGQLPP